MRPVWTVLHVFIFFNVVVLSDTQKKRAKTIREFALRALLG